jgi:hypothetical protein
MNDDDLITHLVVGNFDPPEPAPKQPPKRDYFVVWCVAAILGTCAVVMLLATLL